MNPENGGSGFSCPDCAAPIDYSSSRRPERCAACGLPLSGPLAGRLWIVDRTIAALRAERVELIRGLRDQRANTQPRTEYQVPAVGSESAGDADAAFPPPPGGPAWPLPPHAQHHQRPRQEWSRRRVQNLLLSLGVLLLAVSAIIFIAVNWGVLGAPGRAAVMAGVTLLTGAGAMLAHRRSLPATAEAVAALTVALLAVDAGGLRLTRYTKHTISASSYTAIAVAVIVLLAVAWMRVLPVRPLRFTVAVGAQLVLPLAFASSIHDADRPIAYAACVLAFQAAAVSGVRLACRNRELDPITARALFVGMFAVSLLAFLAALVTCYVKGDWAFAGSIVLVVLAATAVAGAVVENRSGVRDEYLAVTTIALLAAAGTPIAHLDESTRWQSVESLTLGAALVLLLVPRRLRKGPEIVVLGTAGGAALTSLRPVMQAVTAPFAEIRHIWARSWPDVRDLKATEQVRDLAHDTQDPHAWAGTSQTGHVILGLMVTVLMLALGSRLTGLRTVAVPLFGILLLLVPMWTVMTVPFAVGWDLALGAALALASAHRVRRSATPHRDLVGLVGAVTGVFFLLHGSVWSLQTPVLTVIAVGAVLATVIAAAVVGPSQQPYRHVAVTAASALLALEAAVVACYQGASTAQVGIVLAAAAAVLMVGGILAGQRAETPLSRAPQTVGLITGPLAFALARPEPGAFAVALGLLIAACAAGILVSRDPLEPVWGPLLQILACFETAALLHWSHPAVDGAHVALAGTAVAAALIIAAPWLHRADAPPAVSVPTQVTAPIVYLFLLVTVLAFGRADVTWIALLIGGVAGTIATALGYIRKQHPDEILSAAGGTSAFLLLASTWVRLAEAHVHSVEPYTVPAAALLLAVGHLRRRRDPEAASWPCYGPALLLGLLPTLLQALGDTGLLRPALVGVAALAVVLLGAARRLQAPLAVGGTVLAVDALAQLSPYLASAYNAVPRWALIAAVGALLLGLGVTYERRLRDLRTLTRKFSALR